METGQDNQLKSNFNQALHITKTPIIISLFLTPIRFALELIGLPESAIFIIGLLWLTLACAVYWGIKLYNCSNAYLVLFLSLLIFSPISRLPVAILWWVDKKWEIGTHYGFYFDNFGHAILNQVGYGSLIQMIPGFILGSITLMIMNSRKETEMKANTSENE